MEVTTKIFGKVTIADDKIITFPGGIVGFPEMTKFALMHDIDNAGSGLGYLVSLDEPNFAMPVVNPLIVKKDYNPVVEDDLLSGLGEFTSDNTIVLVTITVPHEIEKMTVNLMAPFIINADSLKGAQIILDGDYQIKFPIYEILKAAKEAAGEENK
ncbi:MAG: flagellar assembly protein FliW [Lachnospiraceae bacterium]|nr:flagellar assembly protein FliW [Lachnospiraceae bacterium]